MEFLTGQLKAEKAKKAAKLLEDKKAEVHGGTKAILHFGAFHCCCLVGRIDPIHTFFFDISGQVRARVCFNQPLQSFVCGRKSY